MIKMVFHLALCVKFRFKLIMSIAYRVKICLSYLFRFISKDVVQHVVCDERLRIGLLVKGKAISFYLFSCHSECRGELSQ